MRSGIKKSSKSDRRDLFRAILALETPAECEKFFDDLCTPQELHAFCERWKVAQMLDEDISYRKISEKLGASTATITRVARALIHGQDGYRRILDRLKEKKK